MSARHYRHTMSSRARRTSVTLTVVMIAGALLIPHAEGTSTATAAKGGNSITATATLDTSYDPFEPTTAIRGRIVATGHKYGPRHCLSEREVWAYDTGVSGQTYSIDADTLSPSPAHAPKRRGDILDSYKCRSVSTTVQVDVPPEPLT